MVQPGSSGDTPQPHQIPLITPPQWTLAGSTGEDTSTSDTAGVDAADAGWTLAGITCEDTSTSGDPAANLVAVLAGMENNFNRLALQIAEMQFRIAEIRRQRQKQ